MKRKYMSEFGLGVFTSYVTLIPINCLSEIEKIDRRKYHIYAILSHPKVHFEFDKTWIDEQGIHITLLENDADKVNSYEIPVINDLEGIDYKKVKLKCDFPYQFLTIEIYDDDFLQRNTDFKSKAELRSQELFDLYSFCFKSVDEYEILYIGQSYGNRGERTAITRLSSHSTLQKILTDCHTEYSDRYIYILLLEITTRLNMSFDGVSKEYDKTSEEDNAHMKKVLSCLPIEQQVINITEAAMINYFKPKYNQKYVENFPDIKHKGYKQYFDLDYNCLIVEIDLSFDNSPQIQLFTDTNRINNSFEFIRYNLYNDPKRKNMYEIFQKTRSDFE